jgi:hypothetical protein
MMESKEIILIAVAFALVGLRIYQKYFRKNEKVAGSESKKTTFNETGSDDYEPYSKR